MPVELEKGRHGRFDVMVNGRSAVSRKGGLVARLVKRPWPGGDEIVAAVRESLLGKGEGK